MNLRGGLGYLILMVTLAIYSTLSATAFNSPSNPRAAPEYLIGATSIEKSAIQYKYDRETTLLGCTVM